MSTALKETLRQINQALTQVESLIASTGIKDDVMSVSQISRIKNKANNYFDLVLKNELLFLKNQASQISNKTSSKNLILNIKILAIEQKSEKVMMFKVKTEAEKSSLQSSLSKRAFKIKQLHEKLIEAKIANLNSKQDDRETK